MKNFALSLILFFFSLNSFASDLAPEASLEDLKKLVDSKGAVIIDVNSAKSFESGHIPGAIHFASHEKDLTKVLPSDKTALIVAYCGGTLCTAWESAAKSAKALGYTNIKHFKGGISTWKKSGLKTEMVTKKS